MSQLQPVSETDSFKQSSIARFFPTSSKNISEESDNRDSREDSTFVPEFLSGGSTMNASSAELYLTIPHMKESVNPVLNCGVASSSSMKSKSIECPICTKVVESDENFLLLNRHIDMCLNMDDQKLSNNQQPEPASKRWVEDSLTLRPVNERVREFFALRLISSYRVTFDWKNAAD